MALKGKEVILVTEDRDFAPNLEAIHKEVILRGLKAAMAKVLKEILSKYLYRLRLQQQYMKLKMVK